MTIDERIEFLMQSIESHDRQIAELTDRISIQTANIDKLVEVTNQDATAIRTDERIEFVTQSIESHDRQLGELTEKISDLTGKMTALAGNITRLVEVTNEDATAIRTLARIADAHERRIAGLEGGRAQ